MAYTALLKTPFGPLIGGNTYALTSAMFDLYIDDVYFSAATAGCQLTLTRIAGQIGLVGNNPSTSLSIKAFKHFNSTSYEYTFATTDDDNNGHPNVAADDIKTNIGGIRVTGTFVDGGNTYTFDFNADYYASMSIPNISTSRRSTVITASTFTFSGLEVSSGINKYSPTKPNGSAPYGAGEWIKYCHSIPGNAKIFTSVILDEVIYDGIGYYRVKTSIYEMPVIDSNTNKNKYYYEVWNGSTKLVTSGYIDLSSFTYGNAITEFLNSVASRSDSTVSLTVKLFRTYNTSSVEQIGSATILNVTFYGYDLEFGSITVETVSARIRHCHSLAIWADAAISIYIDAYCEYRDENNDLQNSDVITSGPFSLSAGDNTIDIGVIANISEVVNSFEYAHFKARYTLRGLDRYISNSKAIT